MNDNLRKSRERSARRLDESILDPVEIRSVNDIKKILLEFDPSKNSTHKSIPIKADLTADQKYAVTASTTSRSKRDMLLEGFSIIKRQLKAQNEEVVPVNVDGIDMLPAATGDAAHTFSWIDPLVKQWMGGERKGLFIYWGIDDEQYKYDIYVHKLTKVLHAKS
jgi:hypothetical protein